MIFFLLFSLRGEEGGEERGGGEGKTEQGCWVTIPRHFEISLYQYIRAPASKVSQQYLYDVFTLPRMFPQPLSHQWASGSNNSQWLGPHFMEQTTKQTSLEIHSTMLLITLLPASLHCFEFSCTNTEYLCIPFLLFPTKFLKFHVCNIICILTNKSCLKTRGKAKTTRSQIMVAHTSNPRIWETERDGSLWLQDHPELHKINA